MSSINYYRNQLVPYSIIVHATLGHIESVEYILAHYAGYIAALATRHSYNTQGYPVVIIDEEIRRRLETKLIVKILSFNIH